MVVYLKSVEKRSSMERCSTRNHENATADPSAAPQEDSAKGDDASYYRVEAMGDYGVEAMGEFSGQILAVHWARRTRQILLRMTGVCSKNSVPGG